MVPLREVILTGRADNDDVNVTTSQAVQMAGYFAVLFTETACDVVQVVINETASGPVEARMIPLQEVEPFPPMELKFYYQLQVSSPLLGDPHYWSISQFVAMVESQGLEQATRFFLETAVPNFKELNYLSVPTTYSAINDRLSDAYVQSKQV